MMYDVFVSHAAEDDELAARVAQLLQASGITVFTTGPGFPTGMWSDEVRIGLEESEHFWLLLTDKALDRSVYVHHEFGYFFGFHGQEKPPQDVRLIARKLRYLLKRGDRRRPGMYQHFQDFPIDDFDDPVSIARIIANEIGREFTEPQNPEEFKLASLDWTVLPPEGLNEMQLVRSGSSAAPDYSYGIATIDVSSPRPIFNVSAVTWHPQVHVWPLRTLPQVGAGRRQQLLLRVEWAKREQPPRELQDSYERQFSLRRPHDPGPPWSPLYVTFEVESAQVWAAVAYMQIECQAHGHPETQLLYGPNPYGWVRGRKA
ncbi:MAG: toll/interleukin-1 receptor domain-containing protein [Chloroflexi bacterium]|nr:toll/interleukin-1 receptor domain-containing protein [Chloroflexota bacterium]